MDKLAATARIISVRVPMIPEMSLAEANDCSPPLVAKGERI
jgi:hypothetical protein